MRGSSSEDVVNYIFIYTPIPVNTSRISYYTDGKFDLAFQFVSERSADEHRERTRQRKGERDRKYAIHGLVFQYVRS
jgi:hypothetical protein